MLRYACLFAHAHPSTPASVWDIDTGHVDGWAEWFEQIPQLFLYLIGDATHLPQVASCAMYGDAESPSCLVAPMAEVRARWHALARHMQPLLPQLPADVRAQWAHMHTTIAMTTREWLILDCSQFCEAAIGTPEMEAFLLQVRQRCAEWVAVAEPDAGDLPPVLLPLLSEATGQWGWWNPNVIERIYAIEAQPHEEWPADLRESYEPARDWQPWIDEVQAYYVRRIDRGAEASSPADADPARGPAGLVTPYGRWLVHPDDGAEWIDIEAGYIVIRQHGDWNAGIPGGLKDLNGRWIVPPSAGYVDLSPLTRTLALGRRSPRSEGMDNRMVELLRWPGGELLFDNLTGGMLHDDGRVRIFHADDTQSVLDAATGEPLFDTRYKNVFAFHKKLRLAVVEWRRPSEPSPDDPGILQGVVHESGRLVIPCEYAHIHHAYKQPPKLLHGRQLLAITVDGRPHFYRPDGVLLASPECNMKPWIWTPMVKNNQLLAFDGDGMDARVVWVALSDYSFIETGQTRADCVNMLREGLSGWLPK
ncbi:hypothetical protein WL82_09150 [Burkholderia ubonensis]|uniref:DUF7822 domain-containing protein n=1 Tax=Burkholderia ubonensis TaxID=101571 RepID=UPI0007562A0B|nr:hypothetical protein [Burkholderia ubonensis]KWF10256.1 hypothetical protein WL82_09150 [Burkholderia ubonensis]